MTSNEELQSELDEVFAPVRARILTLEHALEESVNARMRDRDAFEEELHRIRKENETLIQALTFWGQVYKITPTKVTHTYVFGGL